MPDISMYDKRQQFESDLRWAIECPSLIDSLSCEILEASIPSDSIRLDALPHQSTHKVGGYFESLIQFWLANVAGYEIVATGQQISIDGRTVGEIDFLYRDDEGLLTHLETAVKFYLAHKVPGRCSLIGPNAADDFDRKLDRLLNHQLPLSQRFLPNVERRLALMKGVIFYALGDEAHELPYRLAKNHCRGIWIYENEFDPLRNQLDQEADRQSWRFLFMQKPHWLSRVIGSDIGFGFDEFEDRVKDHFVQRESPLMVSCCLVHADREVHRLMVVPRRWPN